jgi:hypothetical protein
MIGPWGRPNGFRVAPKTVIQIRGRALRAREMLDITGSYIDMVDLLENRLDRIGIRYHVVEGTRIRGDAARAVPEKGLLLISDAAHTALYKRDPAFELLVPHELGHFALVHAASFSKTLPSEVHYPVEDSEAQADHFSHEFVMPPFLVQRQCTSAEDIQRVFNMPIKDARIRRDVLRQERLITW